ncbi:MAG: hypothetical protein ACI9GH_000104 [Candidatus Paceibacteria bacterium]|jgi:hypothetical protein
MEEKKGHVTLIAILFIVSFLGGLIFAINAFPKGVSWILFSFALMSLISFIKTMRLSYKK